MKDVLAFQQQQSSQKQSLQQHDKRKSTGRSCSYMEVCGIYEEIVEPRKDEQQAPILDIKFSAREIPCWNGGQTTKFTNDRAFQPTLRQFIQRLEDIGQAKQWSEKAKVLLMPTLLDGGIKHAYDRWRTDHYDDSQSYRKTIEWLESQDKATPNRTICNASLYSIHQGEKESVENYTTRFYELSAGYRDGGHEVLTSIYLNGSNGEFL